MSASPCCSTFDSEDLRTESQVAIVPADYPLATHDRLTPAEVSTSHSPAIAALIRTAAGLRDTAVTARLTRPLSG